MKTQKTNNNNNFEFSIYYFHRKIRTNNFIRKVSSTSFKSLSIYALRVRIL